MNQTPRFVTKAINGGIAVFDRYNFRNASHARGPVTKMTEVRAVHTARESGVHGFIEAGAGVPTGRVAR